MTDQHADQHPHGDSDEPTLADLREALSAAAWDERYSGDRVWSGRPNQRLVEQASELDPGTALDVACGEGGDALWLAGRGWQVTAVDISQVALDKVAAHAIERGVEDQVKVGLYDALADPRPCRASGSTWSR
ncbi:SAM-dependent methyltransferase [Nocardioides sambongensis]|uniref:SAM-dependent methyltransferase n=1 Tax=Nocardioides sambongensis TaxID=2589074 RepID=UPI0011280D88|nr:methyltransferase domain-containing protein [Nocardioides sambongensis]